MIVASFATGNVAGKEDAGGLAGGNGYLITASYATGHVSGDENVGGLVGRNLDAGNITASYATGHVSSGDNVGGLVGFNDASVTGGVWDAETSGIANGVGWGNSDGVTGMTSAELQAAAGYDGAFRDWSIHFVGDDRRYFRYLDDAPGPYDFWDFGASGQYPALSAYLNIDGITVWWEAGQQPAAARPPLLAPTPTRGIAQGRGSRHDADGNGLIEIRFLEQLDAVRHDLDGDGIPEDAAAAEYAAAYPGSGDAVVCGGGCQGYELARPLDFASADSYASGAVYAAWTRAAGWQPIGGEDALNGRYNAIFDGNGHAVANLYINRSRSPAVGLFGYAGYSSVIRNVGLTNVSIAGSKDVGALAGVNMGEIVESYAVGSASAHHQIPGDHAGGLVGNNLGVIWGSHAGVAMSCGEYGEYIGGLAGGNQRSIVDSYATGSVTCANGASLGGLTGANWGAVARSHASGDVTGGRSAGGLTGTQGYDGVIIASHATGNVTGGRDVGGLAGGSSGIIRWSFGTGSVDGDSNVGGLVGQNGGRIIASYASGRVVGAQAVGGLVGANNYGAIIASYATGAASGDMSVGGLAGESRHSDVVASYAIGAVAGTRDAGGLIGAGGLTVRETASFWDAQSTGQESSSNGTGKTTDELQGPTAYTGIFADWNVDLDNADGDDDPATGADDFWDFGTSTEYPVLKFDLDGDGAATWQEFGNQARTAIPAADNCLETVPNAGVVAGSWGSACLSFNRPGSYARYYVFTLDTDSEVFITLVSDDVDTYIYLQKGAGTQSDSFQSQGSSDPYSRIEDGFAAGTYTIEATTYEAGQAGSFTLTVHKPGADDDCVEIMTTVAITGTWSSDCASGRRPESYARFYTFTLTEPSVVIIDLETEGAGAYLYLLRGAGRAGEVLEDYGSRRGSAELGHTLDAGTYTVEVTTYDRAQTGDFTLTVLMAALPPPPPPDVPAPPPEPIPTATLPPAPTPVFVPPPTPAPAGPTSAVTPTATPIAAPEPTPATGSGGACSYPDGNVPPGAAAVSIFLLLAPTAVMSGLRLRARRRGGH